jgi:hypothetical protein
VTTPLLAEGETWPAALVISSRRLLRSTESRRDLPTAQPVRTSAQTPHQTTTHFHPLLSPIPPSSNGGETLFYWWTRLDDWGRALLRHDLKPWRGASPRVRCAGCYASWPSLARAPFGEVVREKICRTPSTVSGAWTPHGRGKEMARRARVRLTYWTHMSAPSLEPGRASEKGIVGQNRWLRPI